MALGTLAVVALLASHAVGPERTIAATPTSFTVASNGTELLASWVDASGVITAQILRASDGVPVGENFQIAEGTAVAVASDGADFLAVWLTASSRQVRFARVSATGERTDHDGVLLDDEHDVDAADRPMIVRHMSPAVTWTGTRWLVGWCTLRELVEARIAFVDRSGDIVSGPSGISPNTGRVWLASNGLDGFAILPNADGGPVTTVIRPDGTRLGSGWLHDSVGEYTTGGRGVGGAASAGEDYLTIYEAERGSSDGGLRIMSHEGEGGLEARWRWISFAKNAKSAISRAGDSYVVGWEEGLDIRVTRVDQDLEPIDRAAGIPVFRRAVLETVVGDAHGAWVFALRGTTMVARRVDFPG